MFSHSYNAYMCTTMRFKKIHCNVITLLITLTIAGIVSVISPLSLTSSFLIFSMFWWYFGYISAEAET